MGIFDVLLEIQAHDTTIDRLTHRRETLPELRELVAIRSRLAALAIQVTDTAARRDEVAGRQALLERELAASEERIGVIDKRMYSGEVSATRDLQAMAAEIESLKGRVSLLEDRALATMDESEPLDAEITALEREAEELEAKAEVVVRAITAAEAGIDDELGSERASREALAVGLPGELAATYERLRARLGGVGAARLENGSCTGCHLRLSATERDHVKKLPPDALAFCEQCERILIRTDGDRPGPTL